MSELPRHPPSLPLRRRLDAGSPRLSGPLLTLASILLPLLLAACGTKGPVQDAEAPAPPVEALQARSGTLPLEERLNGVVRADNQVVVRPEVAGRVVEVLVRSGDAVERGQPLVRLDPQGLREQLRQAEADVRLAGAEADEARARVAELEAEVVRTRKLAAEDLVSDLDLETLEARLDAAEAAAARAAARVEQARAAVSEEEYDVDRAVVRAPASGRVGRRGIEVGTMVAPDTPLFVLGDLDDLVVEIPLTEAMLEYVEAGQPVEITPRQGSRTLEATLSRISPFLEAGSFTTTGEIDLDFSGREDGVRLRPGMFVTVDVLYGESERATLVPASALWEDPRTGVQGIYVFTEAPAGAGTEAVEDPDGEGRPEPVVADEGVPADPSEASFAVELRPVQVVAEGRSVLGVEGVRPGEWVVVVGQYLLAGADAPRARVRTTTWDRILGLQELQREDLLTGFLEKQQRLARERGAEPPSNEEFLRAAPAADGSTGSAAAARPGEEG